MSYWIACGSLYAVSGLRHYNFPLWIRPARSLSRQFFAKLALLPVNQIKDFGLNRMYMSNAYSFAAADVVVPV